MKEVDFDELDVSDIESFSMSDEEFSKLMGKDLEGEEATEFACAAVNASIIGRVDGKPYPRVIKTKYGVEVQPPEDDG